MKSVLILFTLVTMGITFSSCEKEPEIQETVTATINNPLEGTVMNNGDDLNVKVTFTDPTELHTYSVEVWDKNKNTAVLNLSGHTHETSYTVDSTITLSVGTHSLFTITATASNHSGESATHAVNFEVNP
ncbi:MULTISPECIES: hypothetical protein [unclassified Aureispira]|uniref:hypothetical protein n=1 Tax=unclassified Aureispira TaxID=2649989 RepID=UPI00069711E0|nr:MULTISPECIES: hypothetical protein [unclassified Aureispira]WMX14249.1 hypothetical protein QP953_25685 [Aureispira sp. CCB-E]